jgi:beta-glucosidase
VEVTNQFDFADLNNLGVSYTYLTRNDWEGTYPDADFVVNATADIMEQLDCSWYEQPDDAPAVSDFTQGADVTLMFADMKDIPWNDELWDTFLDQFTIADMLTLVVDSNGSAAVEDVTMPATARGDDGVCIQQGSLTATGESAMSWVSEVMTARTWNKDCFTARGHMLGIEASFCELNELWYGGGNIHRTPFGGRNMQYYSEDATFGYFVGAYEAAAMQELGIIYGIKHFAMNDQEAHRESLSTFATEQTIREAYLRSFEGAFCEGGALGVMTGFNRIGSQYSATCKSLLTNVLKDEWGFKGHVTTDAFTASSLYKTHYLEELAAGTDYTCWDSENIAVAIQDAIDRGDGYILQCLREATKHNVYAAVNSIAVNGLSSDTYVVTITPWWEIAMLAVAGVSAILTVGFTVAYLVLNNKKRKMIVSKEAK